MPRIAAISFARLSLKNIPTKKILFVINVVIFISIFAVTASIVSLVYERKIDNLDKTVVNEQMNEIIYNYWLATTPRKLMEIEIILNQNYYLENYFVYMNALEDKLFTQKELGHNPAIDLKRFSYLNLLSLSYSLQDAIIISSTVEDLNKIKKYRNQKKLIQKKYDKIRWEDQAWLLASPSVATELTKERKEELHSKILSLKDEYTEMLGNIKKIYFDFNLKYYSLKKEQSELKIKNIKNKIKIFAKRESDSILIAFIIQLIIFFVIQYFEFGFEIGQNLRRKRK